MKIGKKLFNFITLLTLLILTTYPNFGQEKLSLAIDFSLSQPIGKFEKNLKDNPIGGGLSLSYRFPQSPWVLGISLNMIYCEREKRIELREPIRDQRLPLVLNYFSEAFTTYSMYMGHLFIRFSPSRGIVQPFIEFLLGFNHLVSESSIESNNYPIFRYTGEIERDISDWATNLGVGAGTSLRFGSITSADAYSRVNFGLDIKFKYLRGGNARYLKTITNFDPLRSFLYHQVSETRTDMITGTVSLVFWF